MLWKYRIPTVWKNDNEKSHWRNIYTFCMEEERDINSITYDIDITSYKEGLYLYGEEEMKEVKEVFKEKGYFIEKETMEIFVPESFNKSECLEWLKVAIKEIFEDDTEIQLIKGDEADFVGTNQDSVATMVCNEIIKKIENKIKNI